MKFQTGTKAVQYHPVPYMFLKPFPPNNILIGDDMLQTRFVEQLTNCTCVPRDKVTDDDVLGKDGVLYQMLTAKGLDLSTSVRNKTGVWSASPITAGSMGANALIKAAAEVLREPLKRERLDSLSREVGRRFESGDILDLRVGLWDAVRLMMDDSQHLKWRDIWESTLPSDWAPPGVDLGLRMGSLFKTLTAYILIRNKQEKDVRKMGISPSKILKLRELNLNPEKVYETLKALSRWKGMDLNSEIMMLVLTKIWVS